MRMYGVFDDVRYGSVSVLDAKGLKGISRIVDLRGCGGVGYVCSVNGRPHLTNYFGRFEFACERKQRPATIQEMLNQASIIHSKVPLYLQMQRSLENSLKALQDLSFYVSNSSQRS